MYAVIILLPIISIYPFSYAKYNWQKNNKLGAIGAGLIGILAIAYPTFLILIRQI